MENRLEMAWPNPPALGAACMRDERMKMKLFRPCVVEHSGAKTEYVLQNLHCTVASFLPRRVNPVGE